MKPKRVIPCLDIRKGRVVKGVNFINMRDVTDPVEAAIAYEKAGADELVLLDIDATHEGRATMIEVVERVAKSISIPLSVGGGVRCIDDFDKLLKAGANKVSVNSAAVKNPDIIKEAAQKYTSERVILAIDVKKCGDKWDVIIDGGRTSTGLDAVQWAQKGEKLGAGEILLTSMDADGVKQGYDIPLTKAVAEGVSIPVIASGGAGKLEHFSEAILEGKADAVLAASLFHFGELTVGQVKEYLKSCGIAVSL